MKISTKLLETMFEYCILLQSCEEGIAKIRTASNTSGAPIYYIVNQILYPLVQGCESKDVKIIKVCKNQIYSLVFYFLNM